MGGSASRRLSGCFGGSDARAPKRTAEHACGSGDVLPRLVVRTRDKPRPTTSRPDSFGFRGDPSPYIVAGGFVCLDKHADAAKGAESILAFAKAMLRCARAVKMPHNGLPTEIRVGVHSGAVITGLVGSKLPKFSIFGDTMNTASRMESTCRPGCVQLSRATKDLVSGHRLWPTGGVDVKGQGVMETFLWIPETAAREDYTK